MVESNIRNIDSAIEKEKYVGGTFTEKAFGSFTLDLNKALEYSNFENPTVLLFEIKKGMNVLYMDKNEREMLLPRDLTYEIKKIENVYLEEERIEYIAYNIIFKREENESHAVRIV